jgi:uncharacterized protein
MATDPRSGTPAPSHGNGGPPGHRTWEDLAVAEDHEGWVSRSRVLLTPIAAPSIMGLFGFMIALLLLGAWQAGWYGTAASPLIFWPFAMFAGGIMQSIAAVASLRARDGVAVAVHTAWGSFWVGWGVLQILILLGTVPLIGIGATSPTFAFWFIALTLVTFVGALGALAQNMLLSLTLGFLTLGSMLTAAGFYAGSAVAVNAGGWLFVCSAILALVTASGMMLENAFGRAIIPLGKWSKEANIPRSKVTDSISYPAGMPGVRVGQ